MTARQRGNKLVEKTDILAVLIAIFHLSGPQLISRKTGCQAIVNNNIFRICGVLRQLSKQKRFAQFFTDCFFFIHKYELNGWFAEEIETALWCMEVAGLLSEIVDAHDSEYILNEKLHLRGQNILQALKPDEVELLQELANEFAQLIRKGENGYA